MPNTKDLGLLRLGWMLQGRDVSVIGWFLLAAPSRASSSCSAPPAWELRGWWMCHGKDGPPHSCPKAVPECTGMRYLGL